MQKNNVFNKFYYCRTFFLIASYEILQNDVILINHKSFFQERESLQLYRSRLLEINSLMTKTIKVVDRRKLDLWQKKIILLSRIVILLLKGYFGRKKIILHEKNFKYRKIILFLP